MKAALLVIGLGGALSVRIPQGSTKPSPFAPPTPLVKPMAMTLVWTAKTFPATLPLTHAASEGRARALTCAGNTHAVDWLTEETAIAKGIDPTTTTFAAAAAVPKASRAPAASPTPAAQAPANEQTRLQKVRAAFAIAGEALVELLKARVELMLINFMITLRTRQRAAFDAFVTTVEGAPRPRALSGAQSLPSRPCRTRKHAEHHHD
eukprot:6104453-Prymnesium_polylepis.1